MPDYYLTPSIADDWCADRGYSHWSLLTTQQKEVALINASEWIDRLYTFRGLPEDHTQVRAWPRCDAYRDDGRAITGIPAEVKDAVLMLASAFAESEDLAEQLLGTASRVKQEKAGSIAVHYETLPYRYRSKITRILMAVCVPSMQGQIRRG